MEIKNIDSKKNQIIKGALKIASSSASRRETNSFLVEGARMAQEAGNSGCSIKAVLRTDKASEKYEDYLRTAENKAEAVYRISDEVAETISETNNTQGIFVICEINNNKKILGEKIIILENLQDPNNLGTIIRSADAFGINTVVFSGNCCDLYNSKVIRGSMGAIFRINTVNLGSAEEAALKIKEMGYELLGAVPNRDCEKINKIDFKGKNAVAIGNEGNGLSEKFKSACDALITIPMNGHAESLNAAAAATVIMWEMVRN
jgi:TrmH family RNA methyltransferase